MTKNEFITEAEFNGLCKLVFFQLTPSDSEEFDREVLIYAVYWQMCYLLGQPLDFDREYESRITAFRRNLKNLLDERASNPFDVLQVIDRNIDEQIIYRHKQKTALELKGLRSNFKIADSTVDYYIANG